ncbi:MAG: HNH endonuclease [Sulfuricurvum sp.]|jgi:5-methylcytosine-specific restriction endonuclease McrA
MIRIKRNNLEELAEKHYQAIYSYVNKPSVNSLKKINIGIKKCFGVDWDFEKLIKAKPKELDILADKLKSKSCVVCKLFETYYGYLNNYKEKKFLTNNSKPYRAYELIKSLDINTCPYCNRNTIYNLKYSKKRTSELDHFYPISKYPFFGLSFYNLIPSCKVCNKIKSDNTDREYINPYDERFDFNKNAKFDFKVKGVNFYRSKEEIKLTCKINKKISLEEKKRIKNNIQDFKLFDLYQNHKDIVIELIQKEFTYNETYLDELMKNYEGTLFKNREDLMRLITCGYVSDEDLHKRPLSKLIKDISEELELL